MIGFRNMNDLFKGIELEEENKDIEMSDNGDEMEPGTGDDEA